MRHNVIIVHFVVISFDNILVLILHHYDMNPIIDHYFKHKIDVNLLTLKCIYKMKEAAQNRHCFSE